MTGATRANASEGTPDPAGIGLPAKPLTASASDPPAVHIRARLDAQTRALLANVDGARTGTDPEYVHQVRVSVRRMRAALKSEGASVPNVDELQNELKWLGSALGPVRDLDVLIGRLRNETEDFPPRESDRYANTSSPALKPLMPGPTESTMPATS